jgi:hypothetical protein
MGIMKKGKDLKVFISTRDSVCTAHIRHTETEYDELLLQGLDRWEARDKVYAKVNEILLKWENGKEVSNEIS